jgi:putative ABC transport system substrate-binding protein
VNTRRKLLFALGASALVSPLASFAQPATKVWRVGFLWESDPSSYAAQLDSFKNGMRELGYAEGRDYVIEQRSAQNDFARLPVLVVELLALKVAMIVVSGTPAALAAQKATREIPILFTAVGDPVGSGLAATLARPGGNITGLSVGVGQDLYSKRLDLLRQLAPGVRRVAFLYNPDNATTVRALRQFESDCAKLRFKSFGVPIRGNEEIAPAFKTMQRDKVQGLIVTPGNSKFAWRASIIEHAAKHRLPAVYGLSNFVEAGGLLSYSANYLDLYRRAAAYADKIFKGAKPGDLPIEQPTRFELVLNMKTAKALGLKISNSVLVQATRVIE